MTAVETKRERSTLPSLDRSSPKAEVRFEHLFDAHSIPNEWIEQVEAFTRDPKTIKESINRTLGGVGLLFGLHAPEFAGFLWCEIEPLENMLYVHAYSVDKSVWHTRTHLKCLIKLLEWLKSILKVEKVRWFTNRPGLYRKLGYQPSKTILMEA